MWHSFSNLEYAQWDAMRRSLFANGFYHARYETWPANDSNCVASWCTGTGRCALFLVAFNPDAIV